MPRDAIHRHIAKQIRSLAKQQGWSGNRLADTAGVSRAQLSRLLTLQTSPTIGLLKKIGYKAAAASGQSKEEDK